MEDFCSNFAIRWNRCADAFNGAAVRSDAGDESADDEMFDILREFAVLGVEAAYAGYTVVCDDENYLIALEVDE